MNRKDKKESALMLFCLLGVIIAGWAMLQIDGWSGALLAVPMIASYLALHNRYE